LRAANPRFAFTDPPLRRSLEMALAFAAVLTGPIATAGPPPGVVRLPRPADTGEMVRVSLADPALTATAALVWNGDLPRSLQQILFDAAADMNPSAPASLPSAG